MSQTTLEQHKQVIVDALNVAIQKGCFNIVECQTILQSLTAILESPNVEFGEIKPVVNEEN